MSEERAVYLTSFTMPVSQTMVDDWTELHAKPEVLPRVTRDEAIAEIRAAQVPSVSTLALTLDEAKAIVAEMREINFDAAVHNRLERAEEPVKSWWGGWWTWPGLKREPFHGMILVTEDGVHFGVEWCDYDSYDDGEERESEMIETLDQWERVRAANV